MVCPRCIVSVKELLKEMNLDFLNVQLGRVELVTEPNLDELKLFGNQLRHRGFELLEDKKSKIIATIKSIIIDSIHYKSESKPSSLSTLLTDRLNYDYSYLSRLFSSVEGITIEKFALIQKIEKVKELLFYDELTLSEIAYQLDYSSVSHLSAQFKKETGMTPTTFKKDRSPKRKTLDSL